MSLHPLPQVPLSLLTSTSFVTPHSSASTSTLTPPITAAQPIPADVLLDAACYPHIIDVIFAQSSLSSLLVLRHSLFFSSTVVINKTAPTRVATAPRRYELSPFCWASYIVVIIKKWETPITPPDKVKGSLRAALEGNMGETFHILSAATKSFMPSVLVVGLETLSPGAMGLHAHELRGKSLQDGLRSILKEEWEKERKAEWDGLKRFRTQAGLAAPDRSC